jgi:hypothetical protein
MALYLLFESASGYALFHAHGVDEIGQGVDAARASVLELQRFSKAVKLAGFSPLLLRRRRAQPVQRHLRRYGAFSPPPIPCSLS